jgi:hypothetical protein
MAVRAARVAMTGSGHRNETASRQFDKACSARAVMSSTLPVPLMARYLGAAPGSCLAQLE